MTTLGYIPEQPRSGSQAKDGGGSGQHFGFLSGVIDYGEPPDYLNVRKWAVDLVDAYSSRAALNRNADTAGGALAVTGAAALVGLTAFNGDKSWITGIPIGTAFVGGLLGIYASEPKANIYGVGANYVQGALINSDARNSSLKIASSGGNTNAAADELERIKAKITKEVIGLTTERDDELRIQTVAQGANVTISRDPNKSADEKAKANEAVAIATAGVADLNARIEQANTRLSGIQIAEDSVKVPPVIDLSEHEKTCLWKDVHDIKVHVEGLISALTPSDVTTRLTGVGTSSGKKNGDWVTSKTLDEKNPDLVFLRSPFVSSCGNFM